MSLSHAHVLLSTLFTSYVWLKCKLSHAESKSSSLSSSLALIIKSISGGTIVCWSKPGTKLVANELASVTKELLSGRDGSLTTKLPFLTRINPRRDMLPNDALVDRIPLVSGKFELNSLLLIVMLFLIFVLVLFLLCSPNSNLWTFYYYNCCYYYYRKSCFEFNACW